MSWWCHQMETFFALLALCEGNSPVTGEFPSRRPVTRSFHVFFDLYLNKRLSKQSGRRWFETPSRPLWHHCNVCTILGNFFMYTARDWVWNTWYIKYPGWNSKLWTPQLLNVRLHYHEWYLYPPLQRSWKRGILASPCPSVRLSVCGQNCVCSVSSTILIGSISYLHILSSNFRRCLACNARFKIQKFWRIF